MFNIGSRWTAYDTGKYFHLDVSVLSSVCISILLVGWWWVFVCYQKKQFKISGIVWEHWGCTSDNWEWWRKYKVTHLWSRSRSKTFMMIIYQPQILIVSTSMKTVSTKTLLKQVPNIEKTQSLSAISTYVVHLKIYQVLNIFLPIWNVI